MNKRNLTLIPLSVLSFIMVFSACQAKSGDTTIVENPAVTYSITETTVSEISTTIITKPETTITQVLTEITNSTIDEEYEKFLSQYSSGHSRALIIPAPGELNFVDGKFIGDRDELFIVDGVHSASYHMIDGTLDNYVGQENTDKWVERGIDLNIEGFVKYFGITKEKFLELCEEYRHLKYCYNIDEVYPEG